MSKALNIHLNSYMRVGVGVRLWSWLQGLARTVCRGMCTVLYATFTGSSVGMTCVRESVRECA